MFVFYDIEELILMDRLKLLKVMADNGHAFVVPEMRLLSYSYRKQLVISEIAKRGFIQIVDQNNSLADFIEEHESTFPYAGKSLLALIHYCQTESAIFVLDDKNSLPFLVAEAFAIPTFSLEEFYANTVQEEKYYQFIMELKKEQLLE